MEDGCEKSLCAKLNLEAVGQQAAREASFSFPPNRTLVSMRLVCTNRFSQ